MVYDIIVDLSKLSFVAEAFFPHELLICTAYWWNLELESFNIEMQRLWPYLQMLLHMKLSSLYENRCGLGSRFSKSILLLSEWLCLLQPIVLRIYLILELLKARFCFDSNIFRHKLLIMNFRNIWPMFLIFIETCLLVKSKFFSTFCFAIVCLHRVGFIYCTTAKKLPFQRCYLISKSDYDSGKSKHNHHMDSNEPV